MKRFLSCLLLCAFVAAGLAARPSAPIAFAGADAVVYAAGERSLEVRTLRERLAELDYLDSGSGYEVDEDMLYALKLFCEKNGLAFSEAGVSRAQCDALLYGEGLVGNSPEPSPAIISSDASGGLPGETVVLPADAEHPQVMELQEKLEVLGYMEEQDLSFSVSQDMLYALKQFCEKNGLPYSDAGVTSAAREALLGDAPLIDDHAQEELILCYGDSGDEITQVQMRLMELGFFLDDKISLSHYNDAMQAGVERFCAENNIEYDGSYTIDEALLDVIFSDAARPYEAKNVSWWDSARQYLIGTTRMGEVLVPNLLWLGAAYVALWLVVVALIRLGFSLRERRGRAGSVRGNVRTVRMPNTAQRSRTVDLQICYGGHSDERRCAILKKLSIGRGKGCDLCLTHDDKGISRRHCELFFVSNVLKIRDSSRNGTYVNEKPLHWEETELRSGDRLQIGNHLLIVHY